MHPPFARLVFSALIALPAHTAHAQDAGKVPGVDESKIPDWVKRQAASPQKFIINSTAVRSKAEPPKPEAVPVRPARQANHRQPLPTAEPVAAETGQRSNPQVAPPVASPAASAASSPALASVLTELPPATEALPTPPVAETATAPTPLTQPVPAEATRPVPTEVAVPVAAAPEPAPVTALVLLTKVDPVLTPDLIDGRLTEASVTAAFTVGTQGEVINPQITASTDRRLNRSVLRAVAEWHYAPLSEPRPHSVKFSFAVAP